MKTSSDDNSVPNKPISTNNSDSKVHRGVRLFGSIIDVNSPPRRLRSPIRSSMLINIGDSHLKSPALPCKLALFSAQSTMNNNNNPDECNKASSKFAALLENCPKSIDSKSTPGKRKYFDENSTVSTGNDQPLSEDDDFHHRAKRVSTKKKKILAKSDPVSPVKYANEHSSSQTTISVPSPKNPLSAIQSQSKLSTSPSTQSKSSNTSTVADLYPKEQQLKWMTEKDGQNDIGYYHVLIEQRFKALEATWAQNDQLEREIRELEDENQVLEPMFQQIIELKQMLFGEDDAEDVEGEATS